MQQHFVACPEKALYWTEKRTLLISDFHLGKVSHFRREGFAIPSSAIGDNFVRLNALMHRLSPDRIIFLGDFFHHVYNHEWTKFAEWRRQYPDIQMIVVLGNHDILPDTLFRDIEIGLQDFFIDVPFLFTHHPDEQHEDTLYRFCGHLHPVFCIRSKAKQSLRFPCFVFDAHQGILPSFGVFTGGFEMEARRGRKIFGVVEGKIMQVA